MKLFEYEPYSSEAMYCPSTDEDIFAPDMEEIGENAEAFLGYWHHEFLDQPVIRDKDLKETWEKFYSAYQKKEENDFGFYETVSNFLKTYENPEWIVYDCTFSGMACGPISYSVLYVVKADTIFEDREEEEE